MKKNQKGFALLIEMLIVLALAAILLAMFSLSAVSVIQAKNESNALQAVKELIASENNWHAQWGGANNPGGFPYATGANTHWLTDCTQPATYQASCLASPALLTPGVAYNQYLFSIRMNGGNYEIFAVPRVAAGGRLGYCGGNGDPANGGTNTNNLIYQFPPTSFPMTAFGQCALPDIAKSGTDQGPAGESIKGDKGIQGDPGIQGQPGIGQQGNPGKDGKDGVAATIDGLTAVAVAWNVAPSVTNSGTPQHAVFNFKIPGGQPGVDGMNGTNGGSLVPLTGSIYLNGGSPDNSGCSPNSCGTFGVPNPATAVIGPAVGACVSTSPWYNATDCHTLSTTMISATTFTKMTVVFGAGFCSLGGVCPGNPLKPTLTLYKNGNPTNLSCGVVTNGTCPATGSVSVVPGDALQVALTLNQSAGSSRNQLNPSTITWTLQ